ncbi:MAG: glycoside hydrolase family 99-like domain-containing protein [Pseudomonadota bacterium]
MAKVPARGKTAAKRPAKKAGPRARAAHPAPAKAPGKTELVFVAGMHRSGTSALTRVLSLCGCELPRTLLPPAPNNPDGFWESRRIMDVNDALLRQRRSGWDDIWAAHPSRIGRFIRGEVEAGKTVLREEFSLQRPLALKDPRVSVLFPLWRMVADELDLAPRVIIAVRNPLEVADSLLKRDGIAPLKSTLLWLSHFLAIEQASRGLPRVFVAFDDLLRDWRRCVARIERVLDFPMPLRSSAGDLEIDKFLSRDKRHHQYDLADIKAREDLPAWIAEAYEWALSATQGANEPTPARLDAVARAFYATGDVCAPLMAIEAPPPAIVAQGATNTFQFCLYSSTPNSGFGEETAVRREIELGDDASWIQITSPPYDGAGLSGLRLDPSETLGAFFLREMTLTDESGAVLWRWDGSEWFFNVGTGIIAIPAHEHGGALLEFVNRDPQINFSHIGEIHGRGRVTVNLLAVAAKPLDIERMRLLNAREPDLGRRFASAIAGLAGDIETRLAQSEQKTLEAAAEARAAASQVAERLDAASEHVSALEPRLARLDDMAQALTTQSQGATEAFVARLGAIETQNETLRRDSAEALTSVVGAMDQLKAAQSHDLSAALSAQNEALSGQLATQSHAVITHVADAFAAQQAQSQAVVAHVADALAAQHAAAQAQSASFAAQVGDALAAQAQAFADSTQAALSAMQERARVALETQATTFEHGLRAALEVQGAALAQHTEAALAAQRLAHAEQTQAALDIQARLLNDALDELRGQTTAQFAETTRLSVTAMEALRLDLSVVLAQMADQSDARIGATLEAAAQTRADNAAANEEMRFAIAEVLQAQQRHRIAIETLTRALAEAPSQQQLREIEALVVDANHSILERSAREVQFMREAHAENKRTLAELRSGVEARMQALLDQNRRRALRETDAAAKRMEAVERKIERLAQDITRHAQREDLQAAAQKVDAVQQKLEALTQSVAERNERDEIAADLSRRLSEMASERDDALSDVAELKRETHALRSSTSWRVTAPIRAIKDPRRFFTSAFSRQGRAPRAHAPASAAPAVAHREALAPPEEKVRGTTGGEAEATPAFLPVVSDYVALAQDPMPAAPPARVIAFYLPQFHPIPENDAWWGDGFTEWTNVLKATPQFVGQHQPRLPDELGFYDLRNSAVQERQAELAKLYGIGGFCFYFYWFAGKRLLETPTQAWLNNKNIDFPYCLCWANENWSRRWDGYDAEILIAQDHSAEDDIAFIAHVAQYLRDPRYIRVDGKPLLLVYRPGLFPTARETAARWRQWCRDNGVGEIYLAYTQSFESVDPAEYGFDAAIEFPPNNSSPINVTETIQRINPDWAGTAYDYPTFVARSAAYVRRAYTYFRSVFPSWDNEARRIGRGTSYVGSTPALFRDWTRNAVRDAVEHQSDPDKRLVFVNAWNEWAEGAYLEPDRRYGYAWLQSVRDALIDVASDTQRTKLILVVHDAYLHGAQFLALNLAREFHDTLHRPLEIVILGDGPLKPEFERYGRVHHLAGIDPEGVDAQALAKRLRDEGAVHAICNTTVAGLFLKTLTEAGVRCVALVHELPGVVRQYKLWRHADALREHAALTIFPADFVRDVFPGGAPKKSIVRTQGLYKRNGARSAEQRNAARERLRRHFGLAPNAHIVTSVGFADKRKGIDLFLEIGERVLAADPSAAFVWVGEIEIPLRPEVEAWLKRSAFADRFLFPGFQKETDDFYAGSDVYVLTSREDPFPTVVMESLDVGVPVVAFDGAGGFVDLLKDGTGLLAPQFDVDAFASQVLSLLRDPQKRRAMGETGAARIARDYSFRRYAFDLLAAVDPTFKRVSAVVPNYNYAAHMAARLETIRTQSRPVYEVVVLDDCSNDDSVPVLQKLLADYPIDHELIVNTTNSGSACRQWLKGVERTRGDLVWIAEADDLAEPGFLAEAMAAFRDPQVVMSYCQSQQMSGDGRILCPHYLEYVADIDREKWKSPHVNSGVDEIKQVMAVKNTIPNVSACLFDHAALLGAMRAHIEEIARYRVAGDWATYVRVLERGKIAFSPAPLNKHRRHERSVTIGSFNASLLREILSMQRMVRETYGATPHAAAVARAYAQELYVQFGLANETEPNVSDNEDFAPYLDAATRAAE